MIDYFASLDNGTHHGRRRIYKAVEVPPLEGCPLSSLYLGPRVRVSRLLGLDVVATAPQGLDGVDDSEEGEDGP